MWSDIFRVAYISLYTLKVYGSAQKQVVLCPSSFPASEHLLCQFTAHLGEGGLQAASIKCYLSADLCCGQQHCCASLGFYGVHPVPVSLRCGGTFNIRRRSGEQPGQSTVHTKGVKNGSLSSGCVGRTDKPLCPVSALLWGIHGGAGQQARPPVHFPG